jgi:hypothetical protein
LFQSHKVFFFLECTIFIFLFGNSPYGNANQLHASRTPLRGRVLAVIESPNFGAGVSLLHQEFIFGMETKGNQGSKVIVPIEVSYSFSPSDGPLPESFYDYSKVYVLQGIREQNGDTSLSSLAYISDASDNTISKLIMRIIAPRDMLSMDMVLPLYRIGPKNYKRVK